MNIYLTVLIGWLSIIIWYFSAMPANYRKAKSSNLPIVLTPFTSNNPVFLVVAGVIGRPRLSKIVPKFLWWRINVMIPGWEFLDKYRMMEKLGPNFIVVSPKDNHYMLSDPQVIHQVLARRTDFGRPEIAGKIMGGYGPNLFSVDQDGWKRHRRIVGPALNERIMNTVYDVSVRQAREMMTEWEKSGATETYSTCDSMKTIAINVIGSVSFGDSVSFAESSISEIPPGFQTTFMTSVLSIVNNFFVSVFVPAKWLTLPFMPQKVKNMGIAKKEFPLHTRERINEERRSPNTNSTLIGSLVKVAEAEKGTTAQSSKIATYLTEEEIVGSLFILIIAGFDTTANTLVYAIFVLALYPEWQDWIIESIDEAAKLQPEDQYSTSYPLQNRCLALMFETLRIYTSITETARSITRPQEVNGVNFHTGAIIQICAQTLHLSPKIWGEDSFIFKPSRWVDNEGSLIDPPQHAFIPWSSGPRYCPGMKMAQVEFVAVIREIFSKWKVEVVPHAGETMEAARSRLERMIEDSSPALTLRINKPRDCGLRWVKR